MTSTQPAPRTQAEAIYREALGARKASQSLLPLLELLEEPEAGGSLDEIKLLLATMIEILGQHGRILERIAAEIGPTTDRRPTLP
ncbi:hypothetical protein GCM10007301_36000 [Azorhizobium oxalatiphilum]|uniref:Uncharacterized protein n=1 Tax=Azorhizobium oxalatiphilum TaxID=980631 RepID=A0A917C5E9_9HYPH|nr:hypothetical protein GCM10007301_36000 [Azorhizobium oxalatiphilum]